MLIDEIRAIVARRLEGLDGVVALSEERHCIMPHLYAQGDDLSTLVLGPRYPLALVVREILRHSPGAHLGVVARGCQERALHELSNWKQLDVEQVDVIGFPCSEEQAIECHCSQPYPSEIVAGEKAAGVRDTRADEFQSTHTVEERLEFWRREFAKCIKCYACRSICPLCFCEQCSLEQETWVERGRLPVPFPVFHVIKALHTAGAGKCVSCHACEDACPAGIPLSLMYSVLQRDVEGQFGYKTGTQDNGNPPLFEIAEEA